MLGARDRQSGQVDAGRIVTANRKTLQRFVQSHAAPGATVYTDGASTYRGIPSRVAQSRPRQVCPGHAHTNGIEPFWAMLKRGIVGTFHHVSPKHIDRYVSEFAGRNNMRPLDTLEQMKRIAEGMSGRRLRYRDLIAG